MMTILAMEDLEEVMVVARLRLLPTVVEGKTILPEEAMAALDMDLSRPMAVLATEARNVMKTRAMVVDMAPRGTMMILLPMVVVDMVARSATTTLLPTVVVDMVARSVTMTLLPTVAVDMAAIRLSVMMILLPTVSRSAMMTLPLTAVDMPAKSATMTHLPMVVDMGASKSSNTIARTTTTITADRAIALARRLVLTLPRRIARRTSPLTIPIARPPPATVLPPMVVVTTIVEDTAKNRMAAMAIVTMKRRRRSTVNLVTEVEATEVMDRALLPAVMAGVCNLVTAGVSPTVKLDRLPGMHLAMVAKVIHLALNA